MDYNIEKLKNKELICRNSSFCLAKDVGTHNNIFGGVLMCELDSVAAVFAAEICDTPLIVTKSMQIDFIAPVKVNQIIKTYIGIDNIGNTSIKLNIEIRKHSVHTEKETIVVKATAVFVRIDEEGNSILINDNVRKKYNYKLINEK